MNDESQLSMTDKQLRLATARSLPADAKLDAETAALREGFLALGGAVEAAAGEFDEAALLAGLKSAGCGLDGEVDLASVSLRKPVGDAYRWPRLFVGAVLAATALIAIVRLAAVAPKSDRPTEVVKNHRGPVAPVQGKSATVEQFIPENAESDQFATAWVDPLDQEIALAQAEMSWLTSRPYGVDGSLSQVGQQLEALSQELVGESL